LERPQPPERSAARWIGVILAVALAAALIAAFLIR
jgi:hypothetical protein